MILRDVAARGAPPAAPGFLLEAAPKSSNSRGKGQGLCPWNPTKRLCPLVPRQGRSPWNPSLGEAGRLTPAPLPSSLSNGWIAKALPLLVGPGGQSPPGGSTGKPWPSLGDCLTWAQLPDKISAPWSNLAHH